MLRCDGLACMGDMPEVPGSVNFVAVIAALEGRPADGATSVRNRPVPPAEGFCSMPGNGEMFCDVRFLGAVSWPVAKIKLFELSRP